MFTIYDGRAEFYQWDKDRKIVVKDSSIKQVHFCNRTDSCSLVTEVYLLDGVSVADVPNILLTTDWNINVFGYTGDYTKHSKCFKVNSRSKPADYIYTETEVKNYDAIAAGVTVPVTEIAEEVTTEPIDGTEISEVITWFKYEDIDLANTVNWQGMDNWKIIEPVEEWENTYKQYLIIPTDGGTFSISGLIGSWSADVYYAYISNINPDGSLAGGEIYTFWCNEFGYILTEPFEWWPNDGEAHALAVVIESCWPAEYLLDFSCVVNKGKLGIYDATDLQLTVIKDGVETTYTADTPCIDWQPKWGYNWLTGKGLDASGKVMESEDNAYYGNAFPELATIGKATFKSKIGETAVSYTSYPAKSINSLNAEISRLQMQIKRQQQTIDMIRTMGGF